MNGDGKIDQCWRCPDFGQTPIGLSRLDSNTVRHKKPGQCSIEYKQNACSAGTAFGNPISCSNGQKSQSETDYTGAGSEALSFTRTYRSEVKDKDGNIQYAALPWAPRQALSFSLKVDAPEGRLAEVSFGNGYNTLFLGTANATRLVSSAANLGYVELTDGAWTYVSARGTRYRFDANGALQTQVSLNGESSNYSYISVAGKRVLNKIRNRFGRELTLGYDAAGRMNSLTDPAGKVFSYGYDSLGNLTSVTYPDDTASPSDNPVRRYLFENPQFPKHLTGIVDENGKRYATFAYDERGRGTATEHAGNAERHGFEYLSDSTTRVSEAVSSVGGYAKTYSFARLHGSDKITRIDYSACAGCTLGNASETFSYDANGNPDKVTDRRGLVTDYDYNAQGLETQRIEAAGSPEQRIVTTSYTAAGLRDIVREPGKITDYDYTADNLLQAVTVTDTAANVARRTTYSYHPNKLLASVDGPLPDDFDVTRYSYNDKGDVQTVTNALGHVTRIAATDAHGHPTTIVDANNVTTTLVYTARGWLKARTVAGKTTRYDYDKVGQLKKVTLANGVSLTYVYDDAHRLMTVIDAQNNRLDYARDYQGNIKSTTYKDSSGTLRYLATQIYNELGQLTQSLGADNLGSTLGYDASGNPETQTDAEQKLTTQSFDALNRLKTQLQPGNAQTAFGYNAQGELNSVTDPQALSTTYTRNAFGEVLTETSPNSGTTTFSYDEAGQLKSRTDARGVSVNYSYDTLGRLKLIKHPNAQDDIAYRYDDATPGIFGIGRLTELFNGASTTRYQYNELGQRVTAIRTQGNTRYTTRYGYDAAGLLISTTYPSGRVITTPRDNRGLITGVSSNGTPLASALAYRPFGPLTTLTFANGLILTRDYDQDYRLTTQRVPGVLDVSYSYYPSGNLKAVTDTLASGQNRQYRYGELYQLLDASGDAGNFTFLTDTTFNRKSATTPSGPQTLSLFPNSQRLQKLNSISYGYDAAGNVTTRGDITLKYNGRGRLVEAMRRTSKLASYIYNPLGQRISKTVGATTTHYHYDQQGQLIEETTAAGAVIRSYVYIDGQPIALIDAANNVYAIHNDHLGTPLIVTDSNRAIAWQASYESFGKATVSIAKLEMNLRFPGQYFDKETGFHYNYYRDYDPESGRYLQSDPIGLAGGVNTYAYVAGNPVNNIDRLGLFVGNPSDYARILNPVVNPATATELAVLCARGATAVGLLLTPSVAGDPCGDVIRPAPEANCPEEGDKCRRLAQKIENLKREIYDKRFPDLLSNPGELPWHIGPGEKLSETVRGHVKLLNRQIRRLRELEERYDIECRGK